MPSFGESFGLGALTSWLSGSSKADKDEVGSSEKLTENAYPKGARATTTWSEMVGGKTFAQAMAAVMADIPPSPTDAEKADKLADALKATTLSEHVSPKDEADEYIHIESAQESSPVHVAISHAYNHNPSQVIYGTFLKGLIKMIIEQNWVPLDLKKEGGVKVMDYGAGTGLLSHAFAPYATEILAIDKSAQMVEEYNKIVAMENNTECEMKAVQGDMISHYLTGKRTGIEEPNGVSAGFDVVALCLAVDFLTHDDVGEDAKHEELVRALDVMINVLQANGTVLIIDIEKCDKDCYLDADAHSPGSPHEGFKIMGHGSKGIEKALDELGMEDIAVLVDGEFQFEVKDGSEPDSPTPWRTETYFVVKARRGPMFEERALQRSESSSEGK